MKIGNFAKYRPLALLMVVLMTGALLPAAALAAPPAQEGGIDPAVLAAIQAASVQVAQAAGVGTGGAAHVTSADEPVAEPTPEPTAEPGVDEPVVEEPVASVTSGPVEIPTLDDFEEYTSEGISILAPTQWNVETDSSAGVFVMSDEAAGLEVAMQNFGNDFPGLVIFPIFEASAQALVDSFATDAVISDVSRVELEQDIPMLRIGFSGGNDEGEQKGGVIYIIATGSSAYGLLGGAPTDVWAEFEPLVDEIARSVLLDDDMVDLQIAGSDGLEFADAEAVVPIPAGWYVSRIESGELSLVIADPEITAVGAMVTAVDVAQDDPQLQAMADAIASGLSDEEAQLVADEFVTAMDLGADDLQIDATKTAILPGEGDVVGIIRLMGTAPIEDGPMMDMSIYTAIHTDKVVALVFFGTPENVEAQQETIVQMLNGMTFP